MIPAVAVANPARVRWNGQVAICLICGAHPLPTGVCPVHPPEPTRSALDHERTCEMALPAAIRPPAPVCSCPPLDDARR